MGLQNKESSFIQAVSNRFDIALPQNVELVTLLTPFEESALHISVPDTLTLVTGGGQTVTMELLAGFVPIRIVEVTAQTGSAVIHRIN